MLSGFASVQRIAISLHRPSNANRLVVTEGSHDSSRADYIYESINAGTQVMERVENVRVLDNLEATSPTIERLHGVPLEPSLSDRL